MNYHNKIFRSVQNSDNGEVSSATIFRYFQEDNVLWAEYSGGSIVKGNIIGKVSPDGQIEMRYQHLSQDDSFKTGICHSKPEITEAGRIRLHEHWQWTSGDLSKGHSIIEEISHE